MILEHVNCDLCNSDDYDVQYRKPDNWLWPNMFEFPVVRCRQCQLVYVNPRPTSTEMMNFYPSDYHDGRGDATHLNRYNAQFEYIESFRGKNILDIGCARGDWLEFVASRWDDTALFGVDTISDSVRSDRIRYFRAPLPEAELPKDHFDLITSWAVFEHVHTPGAYFDVVSRVLKPGGKFVFLVTNSESVYGRYAYKEDIPRHLYHFSEHTLKQYAEKNNMILDSIKYDERFWDGSGKNMFRFSIGKLFGAGWRSLRSGKHSLIQRVAMKFGSLVDTVLFAGEWERKLKRSGIIVVTFSR